MPDFKEVLDCLALARITSEPSAFTSTCKLVCTHDTDRESVQANSSLNVPRVLSDYLDLCDPGMKYLEL